MVLRRYAVTIDGRARAVEVEDIETGDRVDGAGGAGGKVRVRVDGCERMLDVRALGDGAWSLLLVGGEARLVHVDGEPGKLGIEVSHPDGEPRSLVASVAGAHGAAKTDAGRSGAAGGSGTSASPFTVRAPIPGKLVKVLVKLGDRVGAGQALLVLEAMKMENELRAPRAGAVVAVHTKEGVAVEAGQDLLTLD